MVNDASMQQPAGRADLGRVGYQRPMPRQLLTIADEDWAQSASEHILSHVSTPVFPDYSVEITAHGALGDGSTDSTAAIARAIDECVRMGGGRVIVPEGTFLTGAIHLQSNVELHVGRGAVLLFSRDPDRYLPGVHTRFEGVELINHSPFIYARGAENVAVTGPGMLDGQADRECRWPWPDGDTAGQCDAAAERAEAISQLHAMADDGLPVEQRRIEAGALLPPAFIQFYQCRNVLIEGVTLRRAPQWSVHPVLCESVRIRGLHIDGYSPDSDGCTPESCRHVVIEHCTLAVAGNCIALRSGRNSDGRRINVPCEDVLIRHCTMTAGRGGVVIGSETSGGVRNLLVHDCRFAEHDVVLHIRTNALRGGVIENVRMQNVVVERAVDAFMCIDLCDDEGDVGVYKPLVHNIDVRRVTVGQCGEHALDLQGLPDDVLAGITISDTLFNRAGAAWRIDNADVALSNVVINDAHYPHRVLKAT
ncbi:pectate lyase-like protein [Kushneria sinocarnis]|uniref:Pectate lyase-like protein n=1 Tax=Kushneria sinocarnis TaxID=595502 RepID=A0A420WWN7_9GAMM|nr:glycoside hydrolase family 28 protein [Kushneria sinocarnis]RKR03514.1 pectate lyase-like protein [Kushneria sinocarnis]